MSANRQHSFWGSLSPLGGLTGAGLLIMASSRLSWAVTIAGSLFWVYGLTTLIFSLLLSSNKLKEKFFPVAGRSILFTCIAAFFASVYLFLFWLLCPFAALETFMLIMLVPLFCACSGILEKILGQPEKHQFDIFENVTDALSQAATLAGLIVAFSILREPLAYCSLSFPGSFAGMVTIMYFKGGTFLPIGILSSSAGAMLLLGFIICIYQQNKTKLFQGRV